MLGARVGRFRFPLGRVGDQRGGDVVDAARDAAVEIAGLEARRNGVRDNDARHRVGQRALEAVADLDAHLSLLWRDEEKDAVVLLGFAELPRAEELVGVRLDLLAAERSDGCDHQLDAGLLLEGRRALFEVGGRDRRENVRGVDDPAGQRRENSPPKKQRRSTERRRGLR